MGKLMAPPAPPPPPSKPMPDVDTIRKNQRREAAKRRTGGRASTVLSSPQLGGQ